MIEIEGLGKRFGRRAALDGVTLTLPTAQVTSIIGPNGAGKTTLIKCILGLTRPTNGRIVVDGLALNGDYAYRRKLGYMPQFARFPDNLRCNEVFDMIQDLRGERPALLQELVAAFQLEKELDKPVRMMSGGTRQKVSAVLALMFDPAILILDEPTAGLDPVASSTLKDRIVGARDAGKAVVLTSHIMSEVEELSDYVVFLLDGRISFEGSTTEIMNRAGERRLERAIARMMTEAAT